MISDLKNKGIILPPVETEEGLEAKQIMDSIREFYVRLDKESNSEIADFCEGYFLNLLRDYPKSMCAQHLTETCKQLITLAYFESKPSQQELERAEHDLEQFGIKSDPWPGYSYEHLGLVFNRSKATIHQAIHEKETEVKAQIEEARLRMVAKKLALEQLVAEEREKLTTEQNNREEQPNKRTEDRTSEMV